MPRIWIARREGLQRGPPHRIATSPAQYAQQGDPAVNELEQGVGASYLIWKTIIGETVKFLSPLDKAVTQAYSVDYSHVTY